MNNPNPQRVAKQFPNGFGDYRAQKHQKQLS